MSHRNIGEDFLHRHIATEAKYGLDHHHIIVDKGDWDIVVQFFKDNPELMDYIDLGPLKLTIDLDL